MVGDGTTKDGNFTHLSLKLVYIEVILFNMYRPCPTIEVLENRCADYVNSKGLLLHLKGLVGWWWGGGGGNIATLLKVLNV